MRSFAVLTLLSCVWGCSRDTSQGDVVVDTVMVFTAEPAAAPGDSIQLQRAVDSLDAAFEAYSARRITADSMARVLYHHYETFGAASIAMDDSLRAAFRREQQRRRREGR